MQSLMNSNISKKVVLLIATLSSFLVAFMGSSINIALPSIGKELEIAVRMDEIV